MKKVLLALAAVCFAFAANAQFVVGGSLSLQHDGTVKSYDGDSYAATLAGKPTTFDLEIAPRLGYQLNENDQIGVKLSWNHSESITKVAKAGDPKELDYKNNAFGNTFGFGLYYRHNCLAFGKFNLFCEANGNLGFGTTKSYNGNTETTTDNTKTFTLKLYVVPGLNYAFNEKFSMDIYLNILKVGYQMNKVTTIASLAGKDEAETNHNWDLLANIDGVNIDALTDALTIGFNYHF